MSKVYINDKLILDFTQKGQKKKDKIIALVHKEDYEKNGDCEHFGSKNLIYDANIVIIEDYILDKKQNRFEINVNYSQAESIENTNFAISIDCCEILVEPNEIIEKVPIYHDKTVLKELLEKNVDDNNVLSIKEKINLLDLYTESEKIKLPARGINCCHLNVFDLKTFLLLNRKTNKYQCPYCKRYANNLYIDGIILDFINDKNNSDVNEILLDIDHNILSYLHGDNNKLVNNEINDNTQNKIQHKDNYDLNKKFVINLSDNVLSSDNSSYFENQDCNVITNFGQVFDIMKNDNINNKNEKNHFSNNRVYLWKNNSKINSKIKSDNISKYPDSKITGQIKAKRGKNYKVYELTNNEMKNPDPDLLLPMSEEIVPEEKVEVNNKEISFLKNNINPNHRLHKILFNEDENNKNIK
jgi:hypothetical protein